MFLSTYYASGTMLRLGNVAMSTAAAAPAFMQQIASLTPNVPVSRPFSWAPVRLEGVCEGVVNLPANPICPGCSELHGLQKYVGFVIRLKLGSNLDSGSGSLLIAAWPKASTWNFISSHFLICKMRIEARVLQRDPVN